MAAIVKCKVCGERFDREKEPAVKVSTQRYAHARCAEGGAGQPTQDEIDLAKLHAYLKDLFKSGYHYPTLNRQIESFVKTNGYSYTGILKSLLFWYEIKGNSLEKANNRIGIVPYVYNDAYNYYLDLYLRNQLNEGKDLNAYKQPETIEIRIKAPRREDHQFRLFNLDD